MLLGLGQRLLGDTLECSQELGRTGKTAVVSCDTPLGKAFCLLF